MKTSETAFVKTSEVQTFKELLLNQRSDILNRTDLYRVDNVLETNVEGDEVDLAVSEVNLSLSLRLQERQGQLLQKIDRALSKIEEGSFGLCEACEEPLHINRLRARPVATLCISCKEDQEVRERIFA